MLHSLWRSRVARVSALRVLALAGGVVGLAVASPNLALAVSAHQVNLTLRDARATSSGNRGTSAGVFLGSPFGRGGILQRVTVTSVSGPVATTAVTFTIFTAEGSISGTGHGTRTANPDGTVSSVGTRTITDGTGAYRGASGQLTVTGTTASNGVTTSHWVGSVRYASGQQSHHSAHKQRKRSFTLSTLIVAVAQSGSPPVSGRVTQANLVDGILAGKTLRGAGTGVTTFSAPGVGHTVGTVFGPTGSVNITITAVGSPNPDGSFSFHGNGKITGGTGAYKGARGTFKEIRGRAPRDAPSTATFTGTITY